LEEDMIPKQKSNNRKKLSEEKEKCTFSWYSQTCPCIKNSPFSCPVIANFTWIEPLLMLLYFSPKCDLLIQVWLYFITLNVYLIRFRFEVNNILTLTVIVYLTRFHFEVNNIKTLTVNVYLTRFHFEVNNILTLSVNVYLIRFHFEVNCILTLTMNVY
jgi:hypothetical protein